MSARTELCRDVMTRLDEMEQQGQDAALNGVGGNMEELQNRLFITAANSTKALILVALQGGEGLFGGAEAGARR